jgi:hypothetical protein
MENTPKNGGAASPVVRRKEGASAGIELSQKTKNVSPFCDDCRPGDIQYASIRDFTDREGFVWHCFKPFTCEHAIILDGAIASCRVRTAALNELGRMLG